MSLASLNMITSTINFKRVSPGDNERRCVTFNTIPSDRTDVDYFSITNSQNDDVMKVEPTESSITLCLDPGTVTLNITTEYICPFTSPPVPFTMEIPGECSLKEICTYSID